MTTNKKLELGDLNSFQDNTDAPLLKGEQGFYARFMDTLQKIVGDIIVGFRPNLGISMC